MSQLQEFCHAGFKYLKFSDTVTTVAFILASLPCSWCSRLFLSVSVSGLFLLLLSSITQRTLFPHTLHTTADWNLTQVKQQLHVMHIFLPVQRSYYTCLLSKDIKV